jgi:hypothetical protein
VFLNIRGVTKIWKPDFRRRISGFYVGLYQYIAVQIKHSAQPAFPAKKRVSLPKWWEIGGKLYQNKNRGYGINRNPLFLLVPRDRIELPTRGFSVLILVI